MSEAVKVVVKCRPMNQREREMRCKQVLQVDPSTGQCIIHNAKDQSAPPKTFTFDGAYDTNATNEQVYEDIAFPLVEGVTEGYNGTVFAYGQTGCGKTYTMQGVDEPLTQSGLIPRAFEHIFDTVTVSEHTRYLIHASFLEIYNEEVRDLLAADIKARLDLRESPDGAVFVKDLSMHRVSRMHDCQLVMDRGWKNRTTGATLMNAVSSRSHSIFTIHLERCDDDGSGSSKACKIRASKLNLVDLAGSERQSKTLASGDRLKEATKINLSLSALGNVISALVDGRSTHIPYRDSKLTRLLQDSLGGNTKTLMIACLSPADNNYEETLSTLRYANRAKHIKNKPRINEDPKDALIRQYLDEINHLKEMLSKASPRDDVQRPKTPEPQIVEKIVHIVDEEELRCKTRQIAAEYEKKMQKMASELAEARASSERTAVEMARLRTESEAKQRQLQDEFLIRAETDRVMLKQEFDAEMERVRLELEAARRSKDLVQSEIDSMRRQYEAAMFSVEQSVPPEQLEAERERLRKEYEHNMKVMREELEAVKTSRSNVETEIENLKVDYEAKLKAAQSVIAVASAATSTDPRPTAASNQEMRQQNLTDEMKMVSDSLGRHQQQEDGRTASDVAAISDEHDADEVDVGSVHSKLVKESLSKYSTENQLTLKCERVPEFNRMDVVKLQNELLFDHDRAVERMNTELADLRKSKDNLAAQVYRIKTEYYESVRRAQETTPSHLIESEKCEIREKYELQMERVKYDLRILKSHRDVYTQQRATQMSIWNSFEAERTKIDENVEAGRVAKNSVPELIRVAVQRYFDESRRLNSVAATNKQNEHIKIINERYEREEMRILDDCDAGRITQEKADSMRDQLINERAESLKAARKQAPGAVGENLAAVNSNSKCNSTNMDIFSAESGRDMSESGGDDVAHRLKTLEDTLIGGGGYVNSGTSEYDRVPDHRRRLIREKLRREKLNAEEKQRRLHEALRSTDGTVASALYDVFASANDELVAKTSALEQLRANNENLEREIGDLQAEFEFDRIDYLDTIRKQDQTLRWYQSVMETILPAVRRDSSYLDLERVRAQSQWDDLNQRWKLPKHTFERKKYSLPSATLNSRSSFVMSSPTGFSVSGDIDYELRSEDRLIEKLQESALRDPAAVYFRSSKRAATALEMRTDVAASRSSDNFVPDQSTPGSMSPLLHRSRQL